MNRYYFNSAVMMGVGLLLLMYQNCGSGFVGRAIDGSQVNPIDSGRTTVASEQGSSNTGSNNTNPNTQAPPTGGTGSSPGTALSIPAYCPFDSNGQAPADFNGRPVIRVCPIGDNRQGCDTNSLRTAVTQLAQNGDRIEVVNDGSVYSECTNIRPSMTDLEIIGVCGRPQMSGPACNLKGFFHNEGANTSISNLEISGIAISMNNGGNGAAIRDQGVNLTVRDVYFHHNQNGILGGAGTVTITWSKFEANGSNRKNKGNGLGYAHNIYMDNSVDHILISHSIFIRARYEGNNLKSRAKHTQFHCSVSASLDGVDSREMDISDGGKLEITNSLFEQGPVSSNSNLIGFATESRSNGQHSILIKDTILINDMSQGSFLYYKADNNSLPINLINVDIVGPGTELIAGRATSTNIIKQNLITFADRGAAGLPTYSKDHLKLPKPPGCPNFRYF